MRIEARHGQGKRIKHLFLHVDGRPQFAKRSIDDVKQVEIAAIDPDL
jgi:hypothetical protein